MPEVGELKDGLKLCEEIMDFLDRYSFRIDRDYIEARSLATVAYIVLSVYSAKVRIKVQKTKNIATVLSNAALVLTNAVTVLTNAVAVLTLHTGSRPFPRHLAMF